MFKNSHGIANNTNVVPLSFTAKTASDNIIAIDYVDGLFAGNQNIILLDNTTGIKTDFKTGVYTFSASAGTDTIIFSLKCQKKFGINIKYSAIAFCILSNFAVLAQPSSENHSGDLEATTETPIDKWLVWIIVVGILYGYNKITAKKQNKRNTFFVI